MLRSVEDVELEQGMSVGAAWLVYDAARQIGIEKALGRGRDGKLALWQVMAQVIGQGSRLLAVRLAQVHAACDILGMRQGFNEEHLYDNLAWLSENQKEIERRLFAVEKQIIHDRYKDLAEVEQAFRTCKTAMLEMRPWYVQREGSTRGHALVVMLAYLITRYLQQAWSHLDLTVEEGLQRLSMLCSTRMVIKDQSSCHRIPNPGDAAAKLLEAANVRLPRVLPYLGARVVSRKALQSHRQSN